MKANAFLPIRLLVFLLALPILASAKHIIGGEIFYSCLGPGSVAGTMKYQFTMNIYRDCGATGGAELDQQAPIAVYEGTDATGWLLKKSFTTPIRDKSYIDFVNDPCFSAPPSVCVQVGNYEWEIELPISTVNYQIVYQRCCRNVSIFNIKTPGDVGATYAIELTPDAQTVCNNGPEFVSFPPTVICANQALHFDHSATDADGDQLTYKFCTPQIGGGPDLQSMGCDGAAPNPPCAPPFGVVQFEPPFSQNNPMGGNPQIKIDPITGLITGKPNTLGQFVVGVCVEERRNGVLLSVLRRDFQFNVTDCEASVMADVKDDSLSGKVHKVINCGSTTLTIINESTRQSKITDWYWVFDLKGKKDTLTGKAPDFTTNWDATVTFPDTGNYKAFLVLNPGKTCSDTADLIIKIRPDIKANFMWAQDSCIEGLTFFKDSSYSLGAPIVTRNWTFGDGGQDFGNKTNLDHLYSNQILNKATLMVVDTSGCTAMTERDIPYLDLPKLAAFSYTPTDLSTFNKTVNFIDQSINAVSWKWLFDTLAYSTARNPKYEFPDTGRVRVTLFITDDRGCKDSTTRILDIIPLVKWTMPNAFTPNDDGKNDFFAGKGFLDGATNFHFSIWNRWGEQIFETTNPDVQWNGRKNQTGELVPNGVYVYLVSFTGPRGEKTELKGFATVIR